MIKNLPVKAEDIRDMDSILGSGRSPRGGHGNTLQYPCLENPTGRGAWRATVHGVGESDVTERLSTAQHGTALASFAFIRRFISTFI